jgi:hypothetical protein
MTSVDRRPPSRIGLSLVRGALFAVALVAQEPAMSQAEPSAEVLAAATTTVVLCRSAVTVPLVPAAGIEPLRRRLAALAPGREVHLVVDGLRVDVDPGALYRVELVGTAKSAPAANVGSFSVFGVSHAEGATAQRSFVVTASLRELADRGGGIAVRFVPDAAAAADARVGIGRVSLVAQ